MDIQAKQGDRKMKNEHKLLIILTIIVIIGVAIGVYWMLPVGD